jgi:imidazolonepropionase-like amidohydrolase
MRRLPLVVVLALAPLPAGAQQADTHAIVGARVITVSGPVYDSATVVMRDGLITAIGPSVTPPPGARVIQGQGLVVTPGLIDGLSALGLPAPARGGSGGGGGSGSPAPNPLAPQALSLDRVKIVPEVAKARDSGITTALVIPKEGVLPGQSVLLNLSGDRPEAMVLRQPAALHLHMASVARQYPGSLMGTMAYARQALFDAARAREAWASWEKAPRGQKRPRYDPALAPWQQVLAGQLPLVVTCTLENDVRRALALADEFKLKLVIAGAPFASRLADTLKVRRVPLLVSVNFDPPRAGSFFGGFDEEQERRKIREAERNPAELARAGVPFALASGWAPDFVAGVRKAIEKGLPRDTALRAATLGAAEALGLADSTGSLETGKLADVVVWSGEPFAKETKARYVFVDGRLYEPEADEKRDNGKAAAGGAAAATTAASAATASSDAPKSEKTDTADDKPLPPLPTSPAPFPVGKPVAITGATILTIGPAGTIDNGTLLIRDGKVAAVGKDVAVPDGAVVIDGKGRYVMPGIIDTHSHSAIDGSVNECTDVITAETRIRDVIDAHDVSLYRQLGGGVTAINVLHGSCNAIGGQNAVIKLRWGKTPDELLFKEAPRGIKFALGENVKRSNFRAPGEPRYPGTRMGVEVVLREGFLRARAYEKEWADYEAKLKSLPAKAEKPVPPRRDLRLETLADVLDGKILVHSHGYRADEMLMLMSVADEFGFKVRTFQHGLEAYKIASEIAKHGAGVGTFIDWWAYKIEALNAIPYNPAILASHGVRVSLNSDSDELARRLYWDAAKAVKYGGVSELEALKMITLNAAWQLGVDKYTGSLEPGKQADVGVWSAHPLSARARCEMTLVDGQVYFDRAKDIEARRSVAEWAPLASSVGAQ